MPRASSDRPDPPKTLPSPATKRWSVALTLTLVLLLLPIGLAAARAGIAQAALMVYGVMSLVTAIAYAEDKRRARKDLRRIPESALHLGELLGGWPGAFIARSLFRHKTQKRRFRLVYALIVASHLYVACDTLLGWRIRDLVIKGFASLFS